MLHTCVLLTVAPWRERRSFYRQAPALAAAGHRVSYTCVEPPGNLVLPDRMLFVRISARQARLARFTGTLNLWRQIARLAPDVLQITCVEQLPLGLAVAARGRAKVVFDCREDFVSAFRQHKDFLPGWTRETAARGIQALLNAGDRRFDGLITSDPRIYELHREMPDDRKMVYFNTPQLSLFRGAYPALRDRPFHLVMLGSMTLRAGMQTLFKALGLLKRRGQVLRLLLIGREWDPITRRACDAIIAEYNLEPQITNVGMVDHAKVPEMLAQARIGISPHHNLPKFRNNIACKVFEYMASGLPVLCSDLPPQHLFVQHGVHGYFFPAGDPQALADGVVRLLAQQDQAEAMGRAGRQAIEERWNCEQENRKLVEMYARVGSRPPRRRETQ